MRPVLQLLCLHCFIKRAGVFTHLRVIGLVPKVTPVGPVLPVGPVGQLLRLEKSLVHPLPHKAPLQASSHMGMFQDLWPAPGTVDGSNGVCGKCSAPQEGMVETRSTKRGTLRAASTDHVLQYNTHDHNPHYLDPHYHNPHYHGQLTAGEPSSTLALLTCATKRLLL
jgi:hypothetical protein